MQFLAFGVFAASAFVAFPVMADKLPLPQAAYSADVVFEAKGKQFTGHMNVDGLKERREIKNAAGVTTIVLIRRDEGKVYDLRPQRHLAVALRIAAAEAAGETGAPGTDVDSFYGTNATTEGNETVNSVPTTKYHIKIEGGPDLTVDAVVWASDDGIVARVIGKTSIDGDNPPASMELKNIVRGPQDAALFEVPSGTEIISPSNEPVGAPAAALQDPQPAAPPAGK